MAKEGVKDAGSIEVSENRAIQASKKGQRNLQESVYSASELAANAKEAFGVKQECVIAALKAAGITKCTATEAKQVIKKFLEKEVE